MTLRFEHQRFGEIELRAEEVLHFDPLPGFPDARRFALMGHDRDSAFCWLVCIDRPELAFVVTHPWLLVPDYDPAVAPEHLAALDGKALEDLDLLVIVTLRDRAATLNLAAPLLVNRAAGRGRQVILEGDHSTRAPLPAPAQIESKPHK